MKRPNPFAKGNPFAGKESRGEEKAEMKKGGMAPPFAKKAKGRKGKKKGFVPFAKKG